MTTPNLPLLSRGRSSKYFTEEQEDPSLASSMDGGYVVTRRRYTRIPRRTWTDGYTYLSETDRNTMQSFYASVGGGADYFNWTHPTTNQLILVRFKDKITWKYIGAGLEERWEMQFKVEEV